jgi:hypothetical protein
MMMEGKTASLHQLCDHEVRACGPISYEEGGIENNAVGIVERMERSSTRIGYKPTARLKLESELSGRGRCQYLVLIEVPLRDDDAVTQAGGEWLARTFARLLEDPMMYTGPQRPRTALKVWQRMTGSPGESGLRICLLPKYRHSGADVGIE